MNPPSTAASSVSYLGPEGTFAHAVAQSQFGQSHRLLAQPDIKSVFDSVLDRRAGSGIVPLENSSAGWIYDTIDLLIGNAARIQITAEHSLDVELAFVGHQGMEIKKIYSHFAPLEHNARWLAENHPKAELIRCPSTAHAATLARTDMTAAAITSRQAAEIYGLDILAFPLGAEDENVTRFMQIALGDGTTAHGKKTGLVLTLDNEPGKLLAFLRPFDAAKLNLSGIISRPIPGKPSMHRFFIEVEGSENDTALNAAVAEARQAALSLVSLGNYTANPRIRN